MSQVQSLAIPVKGLSSRSLEKYLDMTSSGSPSLRIANAETDGWTQYRLSTVQNFHPVTSLLFKVFLNHYHECLFKKVASMLDKHDKINKLL